MPFRNIFKKYVFHWVELVIGSYVGLAPSTTIFSQVLSFLVCHALCKLDCPQVFSLRIQYTAQRTPRIRGTSQVPADPIRCSSGLAPVSGSYVLFLS